MVKRAIIAVHIADWILLPGMKRIAVFCNNLNANGTVKIALSQAEVLQQAGHRVHLFIFHPGGDFLPPPSISLHYVFNASAPQDLDARQRLLQQLVETVEAQAGRFDLFLSNSTKCDRVVAGCDFSPCYYFCHCALQQELLAELRHGPLKFWRRWLEARALIGKRIITVSEGIAAELRTTGWLRPQSVQTIYNPFQLERIRELAQETVADLPEEPFMIHVGRFTRQKRHDILFDALRRMPEAPPLVLLCNRPEKVRRLARKYGVESRILTPGFQHNPYAWIARASLMLLSSDYEGLPTVLIEALACGTPVVSTDCPYGPREILGEELAAYLVPRRDPQALATTAMACLRSPPSVSAPPILHAVASDVIVERYIALCDDSRT